ncbi:hypothetical protein [Candidatus Syntrophocurvum alkaliphilum]|uniref:hypothetical protein n=1 Tax=Candidatus Syntrophocurvum alkaliphilum TaxID=2293317 RepID=UPI0012E2E7ED|nr:hypothetical protein [Candidatus Syntrophocurvum alkaliphilum]
MIKLYAIKCNSGYIKNSQNEELKCVSLDKASVFGDERLNQVNEVINQAKKKGLKEIRLVTLNIIEHDPYNI